MITLNPGLRAHWAHIDRVNGDRINNGHIPAIGSPRDHQTQLGGAANGVSDQVSTRLHDKGPCLVRFWIRHLISLPIKDPHI